MKILRLLWKLFSLLKSCGHIGAEITSDTDSRLLGTQRKRIHEGDL